MAKSDHIRIDIKSLEAHAFTTDLSGALNGNTSEDCGIYTINPEDEMGSGVVVSTSCTDWLTLFYFDVTFNKPVVLSVSDERNMRFIFCQKGYLHYDHSGERSKVDKLSGIIASCSEDECHEIQIDAGVSIRMSYVKFQKLAYYNSDHCRTKSLDPSIRKIFSAQSTHESFYFQGIFGLATAEALEEIVQNKDEGPLRRLFLTAKTLELVHYQLKYFKDFKSSDAGLQLSDYDREAISKARMFIQTNYREPKTLVQLAREVGLNQNKLKSGFKSIYDMTINQYVQLIRMEKAKMMLVTNPDMPVSQVAQEVGYENRGYFAKRFREKYGVLPSDFARSVEIITS